MNIDNMRNIQNTGMGIFDMKSKSHIKDDPAPSMPTDSFSSVSSAPQTDLIKNAGVILDSKGLQKSKYEYRVAGMDTHADGSRFIAYSDPKNPQGNYIASLDPAGKTRWETGTGDDAIKGIFTSPNGNVNVVKEKEIHIFSPQGKPVIKHTFEEELTKPEEFHWQDKAGNNYFLKREKGVQTVHPNMSTTYTRKDGGLYRINKNGQREDVPQDIKDVTGHQVREKEDGTLVFRDGKKLINIDLDKGAKINEMELNIPEPPKSDGFNTTTSQIEDFIPTGDGGAVVIQRSTTTIMPNYNYGDLHMGIGGGFGGFRRWGGMPHPPRDDDFYRNTTTIVNYNIYKVDNQGQVQGKCPDSYSTFYAAPLGKNGVVYSGNTMDEQKKIKINKNIDGKEELFATVEGSIRHMETSPKDGSVFVRHGNRVSQFAPDGSLKKSMPLEGDRENYRVYSVEKDGNLIFIEDKTNSLYQWDLNNNDLIPLTDHNKDYSYKTALLNNKEEKSSSKPAKKETEIKKGEGWISIGGVKLDINS